jgi:hypothetical protein
MVGNSFYNCYGAEGLARHLVCRSGADTSAGLDFEDDPAAGANVNARVDWSAWGRSVTGWQLRDTAADGLIAGGFRWRPRYRIGDFRGLSDDRQPPM